MLVYQHFYFPKNLHFNIDICNYNAFVAETNEELIRIFQDAMQQLFMIQLQQKQTAGHTFTGPLSIISAFYAGGIVSSTIQWIRNDFEISREELAACQKQLLYDLL